MDPKIYWVFRRLKPVQFAFLLFLLLCVSAYTCGSYVLGQPAQEWSVPKLLDVVYVAGPSDMAVAPNGWVYLISDPGSQGEPEIIIMEGQAIIGRIAWPVEDGLGAIARVVINPVTGLVYIIDRWSVPNRLFVLEGKELIAILDVGYALGDVAIHPQTGRVYVSESEPGPVPESGSPGPGSIAVIDGTEVITHITVDRPTNPPGSLVVNPLDGVLYIGQNRYHPADYENVLDLLARIDGTERIDEVLYPFDAGGGIYEIVVNKYTGQMYLARGDFGLLAYYDGDVFHRIDVGSLDYSINTIDIDSRHNWLYAASWDGPPSHVVVIHEDEIIAELPVGTDVRDVTVDETHDYVYAANYRTNTMSIIRGTEVITTVETGGKGPWKIAVDEERGYVYVTNSNSASVAIFGFDQPTQTLWRRFLPFMAR